MIQIYYHVCFGQVDPSGPLATLRKLLLSEESIASFKKWAIDHWYYSGLIVASFLLMLVRLTIVRRQTFNIRK